MPVTISNQRLGPVGQYSSKHPRARDVFHPWRQNGSVAMGACPERFTHSCRFLHLCYRVKRPITACRYMRPHFLATTEGSLPITALLYGLDFPTPWYWTPRTIGLWKETFTQSFYKFFRCYDVVFWCFSSLSGDFSEYLWYVLITSTC